MRVLVTGAGGFVGQHLIPQLLAEGHAVACLTRDPAKLPEAWANLPRAGTDPEGQGIRTLCQQFRPQVVIHLASHYITEHSFTDIATLVQVNLLLGTHLLESMRESGCDALVYAGTSWQHYHNEEYCPANLYAATKQALSTLAEYYRDAFGMRILELHLYDSYGEDDPRKKLINLLELSSKSSDKLKISEGRQLLHLVHIDDVCRGFELACQQVRNFAASERKVFRLPAGERLSLRELVARFDAAAPAYPAQLEWGAKPYRLREVFEPWEDAPALPGWQAEVSIDEGMRRLRCPDLNRSKKS